MSVFQKNDLMWNKLNNAIIKPGDTSVLSGFNTGEAITRSGVST